MTPSDLDAKPSFDSCDDADFEAATVTTSITTLGTEHGHICVVPPFLQESNKEEREPDTGSKVSPICNSEDMKRQATSTEELMTMVFPKSFSLIKFHQKNRQEETIASLSSNTSESQTVLQTSSTSERKVGVLAHMMEKSASINNTVIQRTVSRHGRSEQRWILERKSTDATVIRLVTGTVPILKDGKIMLVSASKKKEWILPKGGWEMDEEMEESAIRETFEEAGVMGVLGPKLPEVKYETRKSRNRRLAVEDDIKKFKAEPENGQFCSGWSDVSQLSEDEHLAFERDDTKNGVTVQAALSSVLTTRTKVGVTEEHDRRNTSFSSLLDNVAPSVRQSAEHYADTASHVTADSELVYSHVCINLFPLYVQQVLPSWPESGRLRRSVGIDEGIELLSGRPELKLLLLEVKAKGLHRV